MIESNRSILLPPPGAAGPAQARAAALPGDVAPVAPVPGLPAGRPWNLAGGEGGETRDRAGRARPTRDDGAPLPRGRGAVIDRAWGGSWSEPARGRRDGPGGGPAASAAFLAQQIFQETMSSGLHLEPWMQGIGAYHRAGAEPTLADGRATVLSLTV